MYDVEVDFGKTYACRYFKIVCKDNAASISEINIVSSKDTPSLPRDIKEIHAKSDKKVKARTYYTIDGRQLSAPQKGIYVEKVTYEDGTIETIKKIF